MRPELKPHIQKLIEAEIARSRHERKAASEPRRISITDQRALLDLDPRRILLGDAEVYDDRGQRPR